MRIVLLGQAAFGEAVFAALLTRGHQIAGIFGPSTTSGGRADPLVAAAANASVPVFQPKRLRDPEVLSQMEALQADLGVMAYVTDIAPAAMFSVPRLGTIQYHPSLLPRHRGGSAINWAVIQGETRTGLTIFWPDGGIDTGPILLQKEVEIGPDDTTGSLYFNKLYPLGVEAMLEAVEQVEIGTAPRLTQDESQATYEPLCTPERCRIDWGRPAREVYALIRGANPQPGANSLFGTTTIRFFDTSPLTEPSLPGLPGEISQIRDEGLVVQTGDSPLLVKRLQPAGQAKGDATAWAASQALRPGDRFT